MGSGTSIEVAKDLGIEAVGLDLHQGFNVLRDSIVRAVGKHADLVLSHPPYGGMVLYSGHVWGSEPHPDDLSHCMDDDDFHTKLQIALFNQRGATAGGGYYGTIISDWRRNGQYSSYQAECIARMPQDELAAVLIKAQHNCMSDNKRYGKMKLPLILHEYVILWQKPKSIQSRLSLLRSVAKQQQARLTGAWISIVRSVMSELGNRASLEDLYHAVEKNADPEKLKRNINWRAKVRQVLNQNRQWFEPVTRGVWELAAD